jgi:aryl-alcohol dehydrogenase-like predicted oxidoreductase
MGRGQQPGARKRPIRRQRQEKRTMQYRPLGTSGIEASVIGLGTWVTGGGAVWGADPDDQESIRAIQTSLDAGVNLIDTAPGYGWGRSEQVVGQAIKGRRDAVIVATKCGLIWDDDRGSPFVELNGKMIHRSLRPDTVVEELERSLTHLDTDYIDLYQTHWPSVEPDKTPIEETMATLLKLKDAGKIKTIGVCNCTLDELTENVQHGPVASHQFRYSPLWRVAEHDIVPYCRQQNIATLTYMSLEQGLLTGKIGMDREFAPDEFRANEDWNPWFKLDNRKRILDLLDRWQELTAKYNGSLAQLTLAWTAAQPGITHVLVGARNARQALENAAAANMKLSKTDQDRMSHDLELLGAPAGEKR